MSLVDFSDDNAVVEKPNTVLSKPEDSKGVTVDTRYTPKSTLLTHIEGSSWIVNYYSQVLNKDNATSGQNVGSNPIYQQYSLIERYEFKVTSPLTTSQDSTTKEMNLVGTANIFPFVVPNEGDMFLADVGDGREAVFKITNSERKTIFKDTAYTIEYVLVDYATKERLADLNSKVITNYIYRKDFLQHGQNPLVTRKEEVLISDLEIRYDEIINVYFKSFLSNEYRTLIIPGQEYSIYDPFLTKAVMKMFSVMETPDIKFVRLLNVDGDNNFDTPTIWDMILRLDKNLMNYVSNQAGLVSTRVFTKDPMMEGIYHSGIQLVVYPATPILDVDYERTNRSKPLSLEKLKHVPPRSNLPLFSSSYQGECGYCDGVMEIDADLKREYIIKRDNIPVDADLTDYVVGGVINGHQWDFSDVIAIEDDTAILIPDIHRVTLDDYYVFTSRFYRQNNGLQEPGMSKLECAVCQMLNRKALDNSLLLYFCETYHSWGALERFYYIPILLMLIKYSIRSV